jgi:hypothetical protein
MSDARKPKNSELGEPKTPFSETFSFMDAIREGEPTAMTDTQTAADHEIIWLEPDCEGNLSAGGDRSWCKDNVYDECPDCGATATKYVRADLIERVERELDHFKNSGIVEVAVRNARVLEYMRHWEGRAERAEAERDALAKALRGMRCPRPCNHRPDDFDAGDCFDAGECGCLAANPLASLQEARK